MSKTIILLLVIALAYRLGAGAPTSADDGEQEDHLESAGMTLNHNLGGNSGFESTNEAPIESNVSGGRNGDCGSLGFLIPKCRSHRNRRKRCSGSDCSETSDDTRELREDGSSSHPERDSGLGNSRENDGSGSTRIAVSKVTDENNGGSKISISSFTTSTGSNSFHSSSSSDVNGGTSSEGSPAFRASSGRGENSGSGLSSSYPESTKKKVYTVTEKKGDGSISVSSFSTSKGSDSSRSFSSSVVKGGTSSVGTSGFSTSSAGSGLSSSDDFKFERENSYNFDQPPAFMQAQNSRQSFYSNLQYW